MKNIKYISKISIVLLTCFVGLFSACKQDEPEMEMPYLFRPINFNAELNKTIATISWAKVDSAISYTFQLSEDSLFNTMLVDTVTNQLSYIKELAGETVFFARVRANASDTTKNSKFNAKLSFKTPKENLFQGFGTSNNTGKLFSAYMTDVKTLTIKWLPGANVTHFIATPADLSSRDSIPISASEALVGIKTIVVTANSCWTIKIYNNKIVRGTATGIIEGDIILNTGDDLTSAITNATDGQVIVIAPGAIIKTGSATNRLGKNIKVRGLSASNRPVLCMTAGTPSATSSMLGFVDGSTIDYVKFENIDFTGYCDNSNTAIKIGYLFNNNLMTTVKNLSFLNCNMHNFGNTPMRLQAGKSQVIDTLSFNGCMFNEIGFVSTYAIVNVNSADYINNIYFSNCTAYNFKGSLILRTVAAPVVATMGTINLTNCTINQGMQDATNARYLIDANGTAITNGITVKNCIFGNTGGAIGANGIRKVATATTTITGSYFTSDYVDDPVTIVTSYSIKSLMSSYAGASTSLWNDPVSGNFTLKASTFPGKSVAGDLRWY